MSSLWTPSGEHPLDRERSEGQTSEARQPTNVAPGADADSAAEADAENELNALRARLAETPAVVVLANHCYGLFELAGVYLSQDPPILAEAQLAIDALGAIIEGLGPRLDDAQPSLRDALAQIRLAFVQVEAATHAVSGRDNGGPTPS
jgi:hypothetical protein